uniref:Glycosyl hydrolase family 79 n=1 Tax=Bradyrhizobium quebecense TaxID=2748629 RepID=A0A973WUF7_9BRAD
MRDHPVLPPRRLACVVVLAIAAFAEAKAAAAELTLDVAAMSRVAAIDPRFQSYNIEMVEVTGGRFWKPYAAARPGAKPERFAARTPINLYDGRLRKLATALAPAYLRVSGTWANSTFFADSDAPPAAAPAGFKGVLTRQRWRDVIDFSHAVDAPIVMSFAISAGTRDAGRRWTSEQARQLLGFTKSTGGQIAAAEFMNEPDLPAIGGAPEHYDAAAYGRDFATFRAFMKDAAPDVTILGPGTIGTGADTKALFAVSAAGIDAVSYHHYGALSARCSGDRTAQQALSDQWLARTGKTLAFYRALRDRLAPDKPIWLTETAETACGGNRWAATFTDTFRYLDQLGRLAKAGVQVVMHNTLAASDYGLLDERTHLPRPNYWAALLWRRLMGTTVLDAGVGEQPGLHVYAHCARDLPDGITLLVINNDRRTRRKLTLPAASQRYTLASEKPVGGNVQLNGSTLVLGPSDQMPALNGEPAPAGAIAFAPATITFLTVANAGNANCR